MTFKIYGDDKVYIEGVFSTKTGADDFQKILNEKVGGFECKAPKQIEGKWRVLSLCQLHRNDDADATAGDRGNTIADCFARIVHIAAKCLPSATISKAEVIAKLKDLVEFLHFAEENPQYYKLDKFLEVVEGCEEDVKTVDQIFQHRAQEFVLSADEQSNLLKGAYIPLPRALEADDLKLRDIQLIQASQQSALQLSPKPLQNRCSQYLGAAGMIGLAIAVVGIYLAWRA